MGSRLLEWADSSRRSRWLVAGWGTTPGTLRVIRAVLVIGVLVTGAVATYAAAVRSDAAHSIATQIEPLSADATALYRSLADADATVASGFLAGGVEPTETRRRYDRDVAQAAASLARAGIQAGDEPVTADRIGDLGAQLPVYTGLVEQARANNRQGLPVGIAYLRRASELMQSTVLSEAESLQQRQAALLDDTYARAESFPVVAAVLGGLCIAGVVAAQVFLFRRTKRVFNLGLLAATTTLVCGLLWWAVAGSVSNGYLHGSLAHSQSVTDALGPAQIAALQARSTEGIALLAKDGGSSESDFAARMQLLARKDGAGGALGAAHKLASDLKGHEQVEAAVDAARGYQLAHGAVRELDAEGRYNDAVAAAIGADPSSAATAFGRLDAALADAVAHERTSFAEDITNAVAWRGGLAVGTGLVAIVAAAGVIFGIGQRLEEYR